MQGVVDSLKLLIGGPQSALAPAGREGERIAALFWWMAGGGVLIWAAVLALAVFAIRSRRYENNPARVGRLFIVGGGVVFPVFTLTSLLVYGLTPLPDLLEPAPAGSVQIRVTAEQWWWRVRYVLTDGRTVEIANEIHLPSGEPSQFWLDSPDVIHSFWIPSLGGKIDMIPGRTNRIKLTPERLGVYRGTCGEYCGASHAFMGFRVIVEDRNAFNAWLARQFEPARTPTDPDALIGSTLFVANGCGACHTIRGTAADGTVGPDLTHVASRLGLAGDTLPNDVRSIEDWLRHPASKKPDALMPPFYMLQTDDIRAMAAYLASLQ